MSSWNYRVVKHKNPDGDWYAVHQVHYNDAGDINAISEDPISPFGESVVELRKDLNLMQMAYTAGVLDYDTIEFACVTTEEAEDIDNE